MISQVQLVGWIGTLCLSFGVAAFIAFAIGDPASLPRQLWARYERRLDDSARSLLMTTSGKRMARVQAASVITATALALVLGNPFFLLGAFLFVVAPTVWLAAQRQKRVTGIEQQLESWLQLLASALRANPAVGAAVGSSATLIAPPLKHELDLVMKKMALGVPLERALLEMGLRLESQTVTSALSTLIVSQRTGGDVPRLLEEAASSLREMARLEGFVRSKTAEAKFQGIVLTLAPFVFIAGVRFLKEDWFDPLFDSGLIGYAIIGGSGLTWLLSVFLMTRILKVED